MTSIVVLIAGAVFVYVLLKSSKRDKHLPPGPPTYPIIGNIPALPLHIQFTNWAKQYGDICTVRIGCLTIIIMSSVDAVRHIIEKNTVITSDRPVNHLAELVCEYQPQPYVPFTRFSELWKNQRKAIHEMLRSQSCQSYVPIQRAETFQLAVEILRNPEEFATHTLRLSFSSVMSIVYGIRIPSSTSYYQVKYYEFVKNWSAILIPGGQMPVDAFPILKYLPEIFAPFKKFAKTLSLQEKALFYGLLEGVEKKVEKGEGNGCFAEVLLGKGKSYGFDRDIINYLCRSLVEAGSDTTNAALQTFILMMIAHPEVLKKAQLEIDAVIGLDRTPVLEDFEHLPYVQACYNEAVRLRPLTPLAVPHATIEALNYNDYLIREGTTLIINSWAIFHDENMFPDPDTYKPERFIDNPDLAKVIEYSFGAGRRVCPGNHFAKNGLYLNIMTLLWGFDIRKVDKVDVNDYVQGIVNEPKHFKCDFKPQSPKHTEMILAEYHATRRDLADFEADFSEEDNAYLRGLTSGGAF